MNHQVNISDTWNAFVFGAVFNAIAASPNETLIQYAVKTVLGGLIWLCFQIIADRIKQKEKPEQKDNKENKSG